MIVGWRRDKPAATPPAPVAVPQPVVHHPARALFRDTVRPPLLPADHHSRARAAARRALAVYPGPAGEVLAAELRSYAEMGWLARSDSAVQRLIDRLMGERAGESNR